MAEITEIAWTDATFNPWSGCAKVSKGCVNCYAATLPPSMRRGAEWGTTTPRVHASESYWREPLKWDRKAALAGVRRRVFCASVADVFEDRPDLDPARARLFDLIEQTPNLDWLLLTKRPEVMARWWSARKLEWASVGVRGEWPVNAWAGTTVEDRDALWRAEALVGVPAPVRFLSMEPLLGEVHPGPWLTRYAPPKFEGQTVYTNGLARAWHGIDWIIVGGESGHRARPMHPAWAEDIRDVCVRAGVPFFFKQNGAWKPGDAGEASPPAVMMGRDGELFESRKVLMEHVRKGGNAVRTPYPMHFVGKVEAGRLLDGRTWDELPHMPVASS